MNVTVTIVAFAAKATIQRVRVLLAKCVDMRAKGHEAFVGDHTQDFLNAEVREDEQLFAAPPEEDGNRYIFGTGGVSCGARERHKA